MYYTDTHGLLLCEKPEWGMGWSRCRFIGAQNNCIKFGEPLGTSQGGWLGRCETCANGAYEARDPAPKELAKPPKAKETAPGKFLHIRDLHDMMKSLSIQMGPEELLIALMKRGVGRITKSNLLKTAAGFYWEGYASSMFTLQSNNLKLAFDKLCAADILIYEKGKSVALNKK